MIIPFCRRSLEGCRPVSAPTLNRRTIGWPMVLSSLLVAGEMCEGIAGGGQESGSAIGRGTKWSVSGEAVWRRGCGWALERNSAEPVRAEQWSGGDRTRRVDRRPHRTEPGRLTCPNSGTTFAAAYAARYKPTGAVCGGLVPTLSAPAAGTAASRLPGTLLAGFTPAEVWRNSGRV